MFAELFKMKLAMSKKKGKNKNHQHDKNKNQDNQRLNQGAASSQAEDSKPVTNGNDENYEVTPIIQYDEFGKVQGIKPSREITDKEFDDIIKNRTSEFAHIHPNLIQIFQKQYERLKKDKARHIFKKRIAYFLIWFYLFVSITFINPDSFLLNKIFGIPILLYSFIRLLALTLIFLIIWRRVGNLRMWKTIGSFVTFPIYPGIWAFIKSVVYYIPKNLIRIKSYYFLYIYVDFVISFFVKFKSMIISASIFSLGILLSFYTNNAISLIIAILLLSTSQLIHLKRRWNELFGPLKIFQMKMTPVDENSGPLTIEKVDEQIKSAIEQERSKTKNSNKKTILVKEIEQYVLYSEVLRALDSNLKEILASQSYLKHLVVKSFYSLLFAVVVL